MGLFKTIILVIFAFGLGTYIDKNKEKIPIVNKFFMDIENFYLYCIITLMILFNLFF